MESESTKERSPEAIALRAFKVETIQKMLDANAFFPRVHTCIRIAAAKQYCQGLRDGYTYGDLRMTSADVEKDNTEIGRMVSRRLAQEHRGGGRNIRISKDNMPWEENSVKGLGMWYASLYNNGIEVVEHMRGVLLENHVSQQDAINAVFEMIQQAEDIFTLTTFEDAIRRFRDEDGARSTMHFELILKEVEAAYVSRVVHLPVLQNAHVPSHVASRMAKRIFAPRQMVQGERVYR